MCSNPRYDDFVQMCEQRGGLVNRVSVPEPTRPLRPRRARGGDGVII